MALFNYTLPPGYKIYSKNGNYYISGNRPKRRVTISENTFILLNKLLTGIYIKTNKKENNILFYLANKSYLKIEPANIPEIDLLPQVSVIIPVKDRAKDLDECLKSLKNLDWPQNKLEIIVIDDGSIDQSAKVAEDQGSIVIKNQNSQGPAAARNKGAEIAQGEILAFIDSDCIAEKNWLKDLIPWLLSEPVGLIGGQVSSYYTKSSLDRYEAACSSLSVSNRFLYETDKKSTFYVPSCNMLVRKELFKKINGFNPEMHLGEDVDLCWRIKDSGAALIFTPTGKIRHKHRNILGAMLKRKLEYGTSEADLYKRHKDYKKSFPLPLSSLGFFLGITAGLITLHWQPLTLSVLFLVISAINKKRLCKIIEVNINMIEALNMAFRTSVAFSYYFTFHIIRYYLLLLFIIALFFTVVFHFLIPAILFISFIDWRIKSPDLNYFSFTFYYLLEQVYYQTGVILGCIKHSYLGCYVVKATLTI